MAVKWHYTCPMAVCIAYNCLGNIDDATVFPFNSKQCTFESRKIFLSVKVLLCSTVQRNQKLWIPDTVFQATKHLPWNKGKLVFSSRQLKFFLVCSDNKYLAYFPDHRMFIVIYWVDTEYMLLYWSLFPKCYYKYYKISGHLCFLWVSTAPHMTTAGITKKQCIDMSWNRGFVQWFNAEVSLLQPGCNTWIN